MAQLAVFRGTYNHNVIAHIYGRTADWLVRLPCLKGPEINKGLILRSARLETCVGSYLASPMHPSSAPYLASERHSQYYFLNFTLGIGSR